MVKQTVNSRYQTAVRRYGQPKKTQDTRRPTTQLRVRPAGSLRNPGIKVQTRTKW